MIDKLNNKVFGKEFPLIILHGLLGSLDNWQSIAKTLAEKYKVYIIDQRNHGKSIHSDEFDYTILCNDLLEFMQQHQITKAHIIGHSMGGKVAMQFAMQHPEMVGKLIIVDVAPVTYEDRHSHIFKALLAVDLDKMTSREEVESKIRAGIPYEDERTIQFLMKGLYRNEANQFAWRFNVKALWNAYQNVASGVDGDGFDGATLFIKGEKSSYINGGNFSTINDLFPNNEVTEINGAGHWVHAEKPNEFIAEVSRFLAL